MNLLLIWIIFYYHYLYLYYLGYDKLSYLVDIIITKIIIFKYYTPAKIINKVMTLCINVK